MYGGGEICTLKLYLFIVPVYESYPKYFCVKIEQKQQLKPIDALTIQQISNVTNIILKKKKILSLGGLGSAFSFYTQ